MLHARRQDPKLRVIDVRVGERYTMGHVPGARHFSIYALNCDDTDDKPLNSFVRMWAFLLGNRGVAFDHTIVICGDVTGMSAARGFWFLEYLGHDDVHVLDGGFTAWQRAALPTTRDAEVPTAVPFKYTPRRDRLATYRDILESIGAADRVILDTRSREEYRGVDVRAARGGAIPGAIHQDWVEHLTADGEMRPAAALRAQFESLGVTPDKEVMPYCQTGYRSAHAYLALRLLGYPRVRNYLGSWKEWGNRPELPVEVPPAAA
jgi:thiosulfate/3-mercaptopyruvate sulfurtransferase